MAGLREKITKREVTINCAIVVLLIGNNQIPWGPNLGPRAQMKKLIQAIFTTYGRKVRKIWVGTVIPRPNREVELEDEVSKINIGFSKAAKDMKRHTFEAKRVEYLASP